jgi:hypothetical protein
MDNWFGALTIVFAAAAIGAILEYVIHAVRHGHKRDHS